MYLPISPYTSLYLHIPPYIPIYLPIPPYTSLYPHIPPYTPMYLLYPGFFCLYTEQKINDNICFLMDSCTDKHTHTLIDSCTDKHTNIYTHHLILVKTNKQNFNVHIKELINNVPFTVRYSQKKYFLTLQNFYSR
jgi:hypothetical protein